MTNYDIRVKEVEALAGRDAESGDMGNPYGDLFARVFVVAATDEHGSFEFTHFAQFADYAGACALAQKVSDAVRRGGWEPDARWWTSRVVYGGPAFEELGEELAWRIREEVEETGRVEI